MESVWQTSRMFLLPAVAAGALAFGVWLVLQTIFSAGKTGTEKALEDFSRVSTPKGVGSGSESDARMGSEAYKIRLAYAGFGINVTGWEKPALYLTYLGVGAGLLVPVLFFGLPVVLALGIPFIGFVAVNALVDSKWQALRMDLEREIPVMLARLSSLLKANPNLIETLENIAEGLDPQKPLKPWVLRLANKLQSQRRKGLEDMQAEAHRISPSLLLAVVEIGRVWETGGGGYSEALRMAAANLSTLMETRSQAYAVSTGAWSTARTILLALGFTLGIVIVSPVSKPYFSTFIIQMALLVVMIWGGIGYWNIRDAINDVVE